MARKLTLLESHYLKWHDCGLCKLCEDRKNVVLLRGAVPAPVLFVGEAPGESEDCADTAFFVGEGSVVLGLPFVGPAGKLFDRIVAAAGIPRDKHALTNIIACIPRDELGKKIVVPPKFAVEACAPRLRECVRLVQPKLIVWVGVEAKKWGPRSLAEPLYEAATVDVLHPAAILRANISQQSLMIQRTVAALREAWESI